MRSRYPVIWARTLGVVIAGTLCTTTAVAQSRRLDAAAARDTSPFATLERVVRAHMAAHDVPGAAVAIVRGDSIVYAQGFGVASIETGAPVTADMLFQVGSTSKMFTGALVSSLAHDGALALDASVRRYVRGLHPAISRVTAHQLLSHSAGLRDEPGGSGLQEESALAAYARSWAAEYAILPPGTVFSYSSPGYALVGLVAQEAARKPFADLMRDRVFTPLGMMRSTYRPLVALTYPTAVGHDRPAGAPPAAKAAVVRPYANDTRFWPAGYAYTSARELARFLIALMNDGQIDGRQALPQPAVVAILARHVDVPNLFADAGYGYGLFVGSYRGLKSAWHDGQMPGFSALVRMLPDRDVGVVVLLNRSGVRSDRIVDAALDALGVPVTPEPRLAPRPALPMSAAEMERYAGRYINRFRVEVFVRDGALYRTWVDREQRIYKIGEHRFTVDSARVDLAAEFTMLPVAEGRPAYLHAFLWAFTRDSR